MIWCSEAVKDPQLWHHPLSHPAPTGARPHRPSVAALDLEEDVIRSFPDLAALLLTSPNKTNIWAPGSLCWLICLWLVALWGRQSWPW